MRNMTSFKKELDSVLHWRGKHAQAIRERDALQQRLTAADERADVLTAALTRIHYRAEAFIDDGMHMPTPSIEVIRDIAARAALKPAERAHQPCESCKGSAFRADPETGIDEGCGACGASGYEPAEGGGDEAMYFERIAQFNDDHDSRPERDD